MALLFLSTMPTFGPGGFPVLDARLFVYQAGTTTPAATYNEAGYSTHQTHPVPADGSGCFPVVYAPPGSYRLRVTDAFGKVYRQIEGYVVEAPSTGGGGGGTVDPTAIAQTGDIKDRYSVGTHAGWVRMAGRTIGSSASDASERANDDCHDLFVHLWSQDANLAVSGGRGGNAEADWAAAKSIALPDQRGRVRISLDDMGAGAAGRLNGGTFTFGSATALGSYGGEASTGLTVAQLPSFTVPVSASMDGQGQHQHNGITGNESGGHFHGLPVYALGIQGGPANIFLPASSGATSSIPTGDRSQPHIHAYTTDPAGFHAHNISVSVGSVGGNGAHNTLQPFLLTSSYIKL